MKTKKETILTKKLISGVPIGTILKVKQRYWKREEKKYVDEIFNVIKVGKDYFSDDDYSSYSIKDMLGDYHCHIEVLQISIPTKHEIVKVISPIDYQEREYLLSVIRPFKKYVTSISKEVAEYEYEKECIRIFIDDGNKDDFCLPCFKEGTMYKEMEIDRKYTLEELAL